MSNLLLARLISFGVNALKIHDTLLFSKGKRRKRKREREREKKKENFLIILEVNIKYSPANSVRRLNFKLAGNARGRGRGEKEKKEAGGIFRNCLSEFHLFALLARETFGAQDETPAK